MPAEAKKLNNLNIYNSDQEVTFAYSPTGDCKDNTYSSTITSFSQQKQSKRDIWGWKQYLNFNTWATSQMWEVVSQKCFWVQTRQKIKTDGKHTIQMLLNKKTGCTFPPTLFEGVAKLKVHLTLQNTLIKIYHKSSVFNYMH